MRRIYEIALEEHIKSLRQMVFLTGPRQVGKTTTCRLLADQGRYLNWDNQDDRATILKGPNEIALALQLNQLHESEPVIVFDELHKYSKWKTLLKGFFDVHGEKTRIIMTGSSRLDVYQRGGDSLMGRYFLYRMHPLSLSEVTDARIPDQELQPPRRPPQEALNHLLTFGGFPEPFLKAETRFVNRWRRLRTE